MHLGKTVAFGTPQQLKESVNGGAASLDDVFSHVTGADLDTGGSYRDTSRTRRTARRLR
jgi:ABC-2 type transport system ATP-binding protein